MTDDTEHGAAPVEDVRADDPSTVDEVAEQERAERERQPTGGDATGPGGRPGDSPDDPVDRSARRERQEQDDQPDPLAVEHGERPPGHPAHADDAMSAGETVSRPRSLPAEAGRPGRRGRHVPD